MNAVRHGFERGAKAASRFTGHPLCFGLAVGVVLVWVISGPLFGFSDTWQLVINTGTTIVTFLMVFLIQNSQNRDAAAVQIKLDELIRATESAENTLLDLEELDEETLEKFRARYEELACKARELLDNDEGDEGVSAPRDSASSREPGRDRRAAAPGPRSCPSAAARTRTRKDWPTSED
ncbi:low affinity iron permease family protein [Lysobacter sp. CA199]|uniref:low affinity iron permease family protein n=1 Tax=Lysobacter sp. CA199 TaxID=3455608 RepID=UPI003F8D4AFF